MKVGAWFAGTPEEFVAHLRSLEQKYPGLEYVHVSNSMFQYASRAPGRADSASRWNSAVAFSGDMWRSSTR